MNRRSMQLRSDAQKSSESAKQKGDKKKKRTISLPKASDAQKDGIEIVGKKRKTHDAFNHGGYTWHMNKTVKTKSGETRYYDCAQSVEYDHFICFQFCKYIFNCIDS